ncbi:MAG: hypothetical protein WCK63_07320 [Betaproteobacteria bacterium]
MQSLKYSLRLMLCRPVLVMLGGIIVVFIVLALVASLIMPSLTWQAALTGGLKFGAILAGAMWAMFFMKTFMAVSASAQAAAMQEQADETPDEGEKDPAAPGDGSKSVAKKQD